MTTTLTWTETHPGVLNQPGVLRSQPLPYGTDAQGRPRTIHALIIQHKLLRGPIGATFEQAVWAGEVNYETYLVSVVEGEETEETEDTEHRPTVDEAKALAEALMAAAV